MCIRDSPRIAFRGWIDALEAEILLTQQAAAGEGYGALAGELEEVLGFVRRYIPVSYTHLDVYKRQRSPASSRTM